MAYIALDKSDIKIYICLLHKLCVPLEANLLNIRGGYSAEAPRRIGFSGAKMCTRYICVVITADFLRHQALISSAAN